MWLDELQFNPLNTLLNCSNPAIDYFTRRDLLEEKVAKINTLWELPAPKKIINKQQDDGFWKYLGGNHKLRSAEDYDQLETFRQLGELVEKYGFHKNHPSIEKAAEFFFKCQTNEGDFRGIYGKQYAPTYSSAIMELLIKSEYFDDLRIEKRFHWLLSHRQNDGGWAIPFRTLKINYTDSLKLPRPLPSDPSKPFSHLITGMVLRAFAAHPEYRQSLTPITLGSY